MLNVPPQSFPSVSSQQRVAPSGQPRNKVALKPGHSLMDWIRLTKSGRDLTGLKGRLIDVTEEELKKHNTRNDCWTCIRGMVYNVSAYMDFHPGGEEELMRAAGMDGTDLFDQVHRWVNYESMLKECLVGKMVVKASTVLKAQPTKKENTHVNGLTPPPPVLPEPAAVPLPAKDHRPRYDWFQTDETVTIVVYTKRKVWCFYSVLHVDPLSCFNPYSVSFSLFLCVSSFCPCQIPNSGCSMVDLQGNILRIEILLGSWSYLLHWSLSHGVEEIVATKTVSSVGKIQVCLRKVVNAKWAQVGQPLESHDSFIRSKDRGLFYRDCVLVSKKEVTHDTQLFCFRLPPGTHMHVPVGRHVYLKASIQGSDVVKPYTPVDEVLMPQKNTVSSDIYLMVKVYPDGLFTPHLDSLDIGASLSISSPDGPFTLRSLRDVTHLYLLAAGTGFTPMARLLRLALQDLSSVRKTKLMFFNRQERDILWHSELEQLCTEEERFQVEYVLSEPPGSWMGRRGQVEATMLQGFLERPEDSKCLVCVCGPSGFTELAVQLVRQQGFSEEEIHAFQG
ncbi:cytochrome b5 reductase 4 isoform X1 [Colossoma macropomum]|uniref:cytochrome b5 reductase 4 isoform X1 n=1 Tax=Colossoma macropomum TaxID=42526 RepID=UPI00186411F5|nr:cytochrome b5 reductase 4 isoform X1 [Colossoma macropomum]